MKCMQRLSRRAVSAVLAAVLTLGGVLAQASDASAVRTGPDRAAAAGAVAPPGGGSPGWTHGEVEASRTASTRTVRMADRSVRLQAFTAPVNYRDPASGTFKPIDVGLLDTTEGTRTVSVNRANAFRVRLPRQLAGDWVSLETSSAKIKLRPAFRPGVAGGAAAGTGSVPARSLSATDRAYPEAFADATLAYESRPTGVKESIVLSKPTSSTAWSFELRCEGVTPRVLPDGSVGLIANGQTTPSFELPRPCMWDARADAGGGGFSDAVHYVLAGTGPVWRLDLVADARWLADPGRAYPVTIDPGVLVVQSGAEDTYVSSATGSVNYALSQNLWVTSASSKWPWTDIALLKLGPDAVAQIASMRDRGYQVTSAKAMLYAATVSAAGQVHASEKATPFITSQLTWNTDDRKVTVDCPSTMVSVYGCYHAFDVAAVVRDWVPKLNATATFAGLALSASSGAHISFASAEQPARAPYVLIDYAGTPSAELAIPTADATLTAPCAVGWRYAETLTGDPQAAYLLEVATSTAGPAIATSGWVSSIGTSAVLPVPPGGWVDGGTYWARVSVKSATGDPGTPNLVSAPSAWVRFSATFHQDISATSTISPSTDWFVESDANRGIDDSPTAGRGSVGLSWAPVAGAKGYTVYLSDGARFRSIGSTIGTSFDTLGRHLYPTDSAIASLPAGFTGSPFTSGTVDLRDDPRPLYAKTGGPGAADSPAYSFKVCATLAYGTPSPASVPTITVELGSRTVHLREDPRHTPAAIGSLFGNDAAVQVDRGDFTLSAADVSIPGVGPAVEMRRRYRSSVTGSSLSAPGWRFSFERSIALAADVATYTDECGDAHVFRRVDGVWRAPVGCTDRLAGDDSGNVTLAHKDLTVTTFDQSGRMARESDAWGNTVVYEWAADGSGLVIRTPIDNPLLLRWRRISVDISSGKVVRATAHVGGGDPDRVVTYSAAPSALWVTRCPGTDGEQATVYRYDSQGRLNALAVPGFTPSIRGEAVWSIGYGSAGTSLTVANDTGCGTPRMPRTIAWDAPRRTATVASPSGTSTLAFDPLGRQTSCTQENTSAPTISVCDADGNVVRTVTPLGRVTSATFDSRGSVLSETNENGAVTRSSHDALGRCCTEIDPRGSVTIRTFEGQTPAVATEDTTLNEEGQCSHVEYAYHADGTMRSESKSIDVSRTLVTEFADYAECAQARTVVERGVEIARGSFADITTRNEFDGFGDVVKSVDALGVTTAVSTLDAAGRTLATADASGTVTNLRYGPLGAVVSTWRSHPSSPGVWVDRRDSEFDGAGNVVTETVRASDGATISTTVHGYDGAGREIWRDASDVPGVAVTRYDAQSNVCQTWAEGSNTSSTIASERSTCDADGQETSTTAPGSIAASDVTTFTPTGDVARAITADGSTTTDVYDDAGDLEREMVSTDNGVAEAGFTDDLGGRTTACVDANETTQTAAFDVDGNVTATRLGSVQPTATTKVNALGWELETTHSDGVVTRKSYREDGRLTSADVGGAITSTSYDGCGRVIAGRNPDGTSVTYAYDLFGRQTCATECCGAVAIRTSRSTYDVAGRVAANEVHTCQWPAEKLVVSAAAPDGTVSATETCRQADSTIASRTDGTGLLRSYVATVGGVGIDFSVLSTDLAGRVTATLSRALPLSRTATYTDAGQLSRTTLGGSRADYVYSSVSGKKTGDMLRFVLGGRTESNAYGYDKTGRVTVATIGGATTTYAYDPETGALVGYRRGTSPTCTLAYQTTSTATWTGRLTRAGDRIYHYDLLGHRVSTGLDGAPIDTTYEWSGDRLAHLAGPSGVSTYTYDASGQRLSSVVATQSKVTTTTYDYEGTRLMRTSGARSDGAYWMIGYLYDGAGKPFALTYRSDTTSPTVLAVETTERNDVRELLTAGGASVALYGYDAYGVPSGTVTAGGGGLSTSEVAEIAERQPLRYAAYVYDAESGLYYCSARYYDPTVAAFISKDPQQADGQESAYQYCTGDPVGKSDPTGAMAMKHLSAASFDWTRELVVGSAFYILRHAKGYRPAGHDGEYFKQPPDGYVDCSGLVTWILWKAKVLNKSAIADWNSGALWQNAPLKSRRPTNRYFDAGRRIQWRVGDIVQSDPPSPHSVGHVAIITRDGPSPYVAESSPTYNGPAIHPLAKRKRTWRYRHAGRYFTTG